MRYLLLSFAALACINSAQAMDATTQSLVITGYVTSQVTAAPSTANGSSRPVTMPPCSSPATG